MTTEDAIEALEALATDADDFGSTRYRMVDAEAIRAVLAALRLTERALLIHIDECWGAVESWHLDQIGGPLDAPGGPHLLGSPNLSDLAMRLHRLAAAGLDAKGGSDGE